MSRSERLFRLIETLKARRWPVSVQTLAEISQVSVRTVYRDLATLQQSGVPVETSGGMGYRLRSDAVATRMRLDDAQRPAIRLGVEPIQHRGPPPPTDTANRPKRGVTANLGAMNRRFPPTFIVGPHPASHNILSRLHGALQKEHRVQVRYVDTAGQETQRTVWPIVLGLFASSTVLAAYCELRGDFRHFRVDRIARLQDTASPIPRSRRTLLDEWWDAQGLPPTDSF